MHGRLLATATTASNSAIMLVRIIMPMLMVNMYST